MDSIKIDILADGTIKIETDGISAPNHVNAENLLREIATLAGGKTQIKPKAGHAHTHTHGGTRHTH